ncbi:MAG: phosphoadenosine phosphosulfate reductase family protein [Mesoflavibacter sp.]|nr:phosphoadenosine phosphosulfate reductase family protein [Mesoflavibacter sp.]
MNNFINDRITDLTNWGNNNGAAERLQNAFNKTTNHVISFSGGRTSAYLVYRLLQIVPNAAVVFCDTGAEHPETYKFIRRFAENFNVDITCLRAVVNPELGKGITYKEIDIKDIKHDLKPFKSVMQKYSTPYIGGAFCTDRMKATPFKKYCEDKWGRGNYKTWLGIRIDEPKRIRKSNQFLYLADICDYEKQDILNFWKKQSFDLGIQEHLGNCVFCIKKSYGKIALAARDEPKLAKDFIKIINIAADRPSKEDKRIMYRNHNTLESIIDQYADYSRTDIIGRLKNSHQYQSECSESCEAVGEQLKFDF